MTREEAITYLKVIWNRYATVYKTETETTEAYRMAIEALSEPSKVDYRTDESANIGTEVNDLISREDVQKSIKTWYEDMGVDTHGVWNKQLAEIVLNKDADDLALDFRGLMTMFDTLPTADRPTGVWHDSHGFAHCSLCGLGVLRPIGKETNFNYCPKCGARLYKAGESHEAD